MRINLALFLVFCLQSAWATNPVDDQDLTDERPLTGALQRLNMGQLDVWRGNGSIDCRYGRLTISAAPQETGSNWSWSATNQDSVEIIPRENGQVVEASYFSQKKTAKHQVITLSHDSLSELPNDLLCVIFGYVPQADWAAILSISKLWNHLAKKSIQDDHIVDLSHVQVAKFLYIDQQKNAPHPWAAGIKHVRYRLPEIIPAPGAIPLKAQPDLQRFMSMLKICEDLYLEERVIQDRPLEVHNFLDQIMQRAKRLHLSFCGRQARAPFSINHGAHRGHPCWSRWLSQSNLYSLNVEKCTPQLCVGVRTTNGDYLNLDEIIKHLPNETHVKLVLQLDAFDDELNDIRNSMIRAAGHLSGKLQSELIFSVAMFSEMPPEPFSTELSTSVLNLLGDLHSQRDLTIHLKNIFSPYSRNLDRQLWGNPRYLSANNAVFRGDFEEFEVHLSSQWDAFLSHLTAMSNKVNFVLDFDPNRPLYANKSKFSASLAQTFNDMHRRGTLGSLILRDENSNDFSLSINNRDPKADVDPFEYYDFQQEFYEAVYGKQGNSTSSISSSPANS
ncbi:MAG: F-box protein [Holosporales bacterium]